MEVRTSQPALRLLQATVDNTLGVPATKPASSPGSAHEPNMRIDHNYMRDLAMTRDLALAPSHFSFRQVISTRTGISFFTAIVRSDGGLILKSASVTGMVPVIFVSFPCFDCSNRTCLYLAV